MTPHIWYIAGASGTGKSTRAREIAAECDPSRSLLISTDVVRAQLRSVVTQEQHPDLWGESFNLPHHTDDELRTARDGSLVNISGFLRQCEPILKAVHAAVDYGISEGWDIVVEGVHLVPGLLEVPSHTPTTLLLMQVLDNEDHARRFIAREQSSGGGRPAQHYITNLPRINVIQQLLHERWTEWHTHIERSALCSTRIES